MDEQQEMMELTIDLLPEPVTRPFSDGWLWVKQAMVIFNQKLVIWILMSSIILLLNYASGGILKQILMAGVVFSVALWVEEDDLKIEYLFSGFEYNFKKLIILSLFNILGSFLILLLCLFCWIMIIWGWKILDLDFKMLIASMFIYPYFIIFSLGEAPIFETITLILFLSITPILLSLCNWFALPLIMLHDIKPLQAIKMSLFSCLKNVLPMLCLGFLSFLVWISIIAMMIAGLFMKKYFMIILGIFMLLILLFQIFGMIVSYVSYRSVWTNLPIDEY